MFLLSLPPNSPEVADELLERLHPLGQRDDNVDDDAVGVHTLTPHLHHGTEGPEEDELGEALRTVAFKQQLIDAASVPFCASQP